MNCNMRFRPVVCADGRLLLPAPGGLEPQKVWEGLRFGSACLHPEHPSRAVFQIIALPPRWPIQTGEAPQIVALQMDEAALRRAAAELIELADEIALKPPTTRPKRKPR